MNPYSTCGSQLLESSEAMTIPPPGNARKLKTNHLRVRKYKHPHQPYEMTWDKLGESFSQNKFRYREQLGWSLKRNAEFMKHFMCLTASFKFYKGFEMAGLCSRIRLHQTLNGYNLKKKLNNYLSSSRPSNLLNLFSCGYPFWYW